MNKQQLMRVVQISTQGLLVVLMVLLAVRIVLETADIWIPIEYRMSGFPVDRYGFSTEDRIFWSQVDVEFLMGDYEITYFDEYKLLDGSPMHNERELRHMQDVYGLIQIVWDILAWGFLAALIGLIILGRINSLDKIAESLKMSSRWTLILMLVLGAALVVAFGVFFVGFHRIFFEGDTWIFLYSDTFIRLYPERFWRDTFALVVIVTLVEAGFVYLLGRVILPIFSRQRSD
jgi:integral membrane protein (TIGR01906 family)